MAGIIPPQPTYTCSVFVKNNVKSAYRVNGRAGSTSLPVLAAHNAFVPYYFPIRHHSRLLVQALRPLPQLLRTKTLGPLSFLCALPSVLESVAPPGTPSRSCRSPFFGIDSVFRVQERCLQD